MPDLIANPNITLSLKETGSIMLPITGTLLGLVYAAFIYWLQGGFSKLEFTKTLLEDLMIADARVLLDLLIGASAISLFAVFETTTLVSVGFWIFAIVLIKDLLKAVAEQGYIITLFSTKYIPAEFGRFRQFLRKLRNAGVANWIRPVFLIFITVIYPVWLTFKVNPSWVVSNKSAIIFIYLTSAVSLLQIKSLLTVAFEVRKQLEKSMMTENETKAMQLEDKMITWSDKKIQLEQRIINERLLSIGILPYSKNKDLQVKHKWSSRDLNDKPVINGEPWIKEHGALHINIIIPYLENDHLTREFIFRWTKCILEVLAISKTEIRQYGLSFYRREIGESDTHFALIRANRDEVLKAVSSKLEGKDFVKNLSGRYLADAVAEF